MLSNAEGASPECDDIPRSGTSRITIRTALLKVGRAYVQADGGWANDSEPEAEFQETVNKSKATHPPSRAGGPTEDRCSKPWC